MQFFYKWFVSEKEVVGNLPLTFPKKLRKKQLDRLIKSVRKLLFFKKLKKSLGITPPKKPITHTKVIQHKPMTKFNKNEMFCAKCLTHETFFIGGGSWSPDFCPTCKDNDIIFYRKLTIEQKHIAKKKFDKMWKEQRLNL